MSRRSSDKPIVREGAARWQFVIPFAVLCLGWVWTSRAELAEVRAQTSMMPDRRDRELDQLIGRVAALEGRCR